MNRLPDGRRVGEDEGVAALRTRVMVAVMATIVLAGCKGSRDRDVAEPSATAPAAAPGGPLDVRAEEGTIAVFAPKHRRPWTANFAVNVCVKDGAARSVVVDAVRYIKRSGEGRVVTRLRTATADDVRRGLTGFGSDVGSPQSIPRRFGGSLRPIEKARVEDRCGARERDGESQVITSVTVGEEGLRVAGLTVAYRFDGQAFEVTSPFTYVACGSEQGRRCRRGAA